MDPLADKVLICSVVAALGIQVRCAFALHVLALHRNAHAEVCCQPRLQ